MSFEDAWQQAARRRRLRSSTVRSRPDTDKVVEEDVIHLRHLPVRLSV